jgi:hypothetical protein
MKLGLSLSVSSVLAAPGTNPAPTITSLDVTSGLSTGGTTVTITGTGFLASPAVTFGGASATSVVVVSSTSITCATPTGTPGAVDVVVTNADTQSVTSTNGYTYILDPASLNLSLWSRASYGGSPWASLASAGVSSGRDLVEGTNPPAVGAAITGTLTPADFDGTNDKLRTPISPGILLFSDFITASAFTFVVLFKADTAAADGGDSASYDNPCLIGDISNDGGIGVAFSDSGVRGFSYSGQDWSSTAVACATGAWHCAQVKLVSGVLKTRVDTGSWNNQNRNNVAVASIGAAPVIGRNYNAKFFDGKIAEIIMSPVALSDAVLTQLVAYFNWRYALSL